MTAISVSHISKGLLCCRRCVTEATADHDASEAKWAAGILLPLHLQRCTCNRYIAMSSYVVFIRSVESLQSRRLHIQAIT